MLALLLGACAGDARPSGPDPTCREVVSGHSWAVRDWGSAPINDIWTGSSAEGTFYVRAARSDGSVAGLSRPGRLGEVPLSKRPLIGIVGTGSGVLVALDSNGSTYEGSTAASAVWGERLPIVSEQTLHALTASASGEMWAVGSGGLIAHFDGQTWSLDVHPDGSSLENAWAQDGELWVVGEAGVSRQDSDGSWHAVGSGMGTLRGIFGLPDGRIWVVGDAGAWFVWDGLDWQRIITNTNETLRAVWADPDEGAWAAGDGGVLLHSTASEGSARVEQLPATAASTRVTALHGARLPRLSAIGAAPDYVLELWGGTTAGSVILRQEITSTVCP